MKRENVTQHEIHLLVPDSDGRITRTKRRTQRTKLDTSHRNMQ